MTRLSTSPMSISLHDYSSSSLDSFMEHFSARDQCKRVERRTRNKNNNEPKRDPTALRTRTFIIDKPSPADRDDSSKQLARTCSTETVLCDKSTTTMTESVAGEDPAPEGHTDKDQTGQPLKGVLKLPGEQPRGDAKHVRFDSETLLSSRIVRDEEDEHDDEHEDEGGSLVADEFSCCEGDTDPEDDDDDEDYSYNEDHESDDDDDDEESQSSSDPLDNDEEEQVEASVFADESLAQINKHKNTTMLLMSLTNPEAADEAETGSLHNLVHNAAAGTHVSESAYPPTLAPVSLHSLQSAHTHALAHTHATVHELSHARGLKRALISSGPAVTAPGYTQIFTREGEGEGEQPVRKKRCLAVSPRKTERKTL